jgi:hypothetical protein
LLLTLAIGGMHLTGMAGMTLVPDFAIEVPKAVQEPSAVAFGLAAGAMLILGLGLAGVIVENDLAKGTSGESERLRAMCRRCKRPRGCLRTPRKILS